MTSIVDTSVKHFTSKMLASPNMTGQIGSLLAVLSACLVDGFDVKAAISLVVTGGVARITFAGDHSAVRDSVVLVAGVTGALVALNGEQRVTAIGAGYVEFATASANGAAAGSINFKIAGAGWLKPFTGTNVAVFKSADPASTGKCLRVSDIAVQMCRVVGYESMTSADTGVGPFPSVAQQSGGGYWAKSNLSTAAVVNWTLVADGRLFFLHIAPYSSVNVGFTGGVTRYFGDFVPYRPGGDPYACALNYAAGAVVSAQWDGGADAPYLVQHAMPRGYPGLGSSTLHALIPFTGVTSSSSGTDNYFSSFPSNIDGGLRLSKKWFGESTSRPPRGEMPGLYHVPMSSVLDAFTTGDIINGTGPLWGRRLIALNPSAAISAVPVATTTGVSFVDITGPWR